MSATVATVRNNKRLLRPLVTSGPVPPSLRDRPLLLSILRVDQPTSSLSKTQSNGVVKTMQRSGAAVERKAELGAPSPRSQLQQWFDGAEYSTPPRPEKISRGHRRSNVTMSLSYNQPATASPQPIPSPNPRTPCLDHVRRPSISLAFVSPFQHTHPTAFSECTA